MSGNKTEHKIVARANRTEGQEVETRIVSLTVDILRLHFRSTLQVAARNLGISVTALKRLPNEIKYLKETVCSNLLKLFCSVVADKSG